MIPEDQYINMKNNKNDDQEGGALLSSKSKESPEVQMKLFHDEHSKSQAKQWNKELETAENVNKRIQPLLALHSSHIEEVIKNIPQNHQANANFVLQVLSRLPKVAIIRNHITIEGEVLREPASSIVQDIINNGVVSSRKIIEAMRQGRKRTVSLTPSQSSIMTPSRIKSPSSVSRSGIPSLNTSSRRKAENSSSFQSFSEVMNPLFSSTPSSISSRDNTQQQSRRNVSAEPEKTPTPKPNIKRKYGGRYPDSASPVKTRKPFVGATASEPRSKTTRTPRQILRFLRETPQKRGGEDNGKQKRGGKPTWETFD